MTRFLSRALGAIEPAFSQSIRQLERAAGAPGTDIRLTAAIVQRTRAKIAELGLDPNDTTGPELYRALQERLKRDEFTVRTVLGVADNASSEDVVSAVHAYLSGHTNIPKSCFALKSSVAKRMLKKKLPKNAMKRLGYRSADSMIKHEAVASIYAAALISEPASWHKAFRDQYVKLSPSDFETRDICIVHPTSKRWQDLAKQHVGASRHHILSFHELGAIVLLPLSEAVNGLAITTLLLAAEEMNAIRSHSSYAKLQQVKPDFGTRLQASSASEPYTSAVLAGQPVPWRMIQRYYARFTQAAYHPEIFEPHVQPEDLQWTAGETVLAALAPSLEFWQGTETLGLLHDGEIVSCNVLDVALGYCNVLSYPERIVHFVRDTLWHELMMQYLNQENLEAAVHQQLHNELAGEHLALQEQEAYNKA